MGEARLRGDFEERKSQAIAQGRKKISFPHLGSFGVNYSMTGGHRNSSIYGRKPHRLNRPWKRRAAGL